MPLYDQYGYLYEKSVCTMACGGILGILTLCLCLKLLWGVSPTGPLACYFQCNLDPHGGISLLSDGYYDSTLCHPLVHYMTGDHELW